MSDREAHVGDSGAGIFLSGSDLETLGIDPAATDRVRYDVTADGVELREVADE